MTHPWEDFTKLKPTPPPPKRIGKPISCKNYYTFTEAELESSIASIRDWFMDSPNPQHYKKVFLALEVALSTYDLVHRDAFTQLVLDELT